MASLFSSVKAVARAATSTQDTLAISKTCYQTRKKALKTPFKETLKIRLSADEGKYHHPAILLEEFTYEKADFPSIHAPSIEDLPNGDLVTVFFGGAGEGRPNTVIRGQKNRNSEVPAIPPVSVLSRTNRSGLKTATFWQVPAARTKVVF